MQSMSLHAVMSDSSVHLQLCLDIKDFQIPFPVTPSFWCLPFTSVIAILVLCVLGRQACRQVRCFGVSLRCRTLLRKVSGCRPAFPRTCAWSCAPRIPRCQSSVGRASRGAGCSGGPFTDCLGPSGGGGGWLPEGVADTCRALLVDFSLEVASFVARYDPVTSCGGHAQARPASCFPGGPCLVQTKLFCNGVFPQRRRRPLKVVAHLGRGSYQPTYKVPKGWR